MKSYPIQVLFREYFEGILAAVFLALFLRFFILSILYIPTDSMSPNLERGDFVIGWRIAYGFPLPLMKGERLNFKTPQHSDVISFRFPGDEEQIIVRRVIGLPGDKIEIKDNKVFLNDLPTLIQEDDSGYGFEQLNEQENKYKVQPTYRANLEKLEVPEGHVFVLSDNRRRTDDSRDWGFVPFNNIESRLGFIWLSLNNQEKNLKINWARMFQWVL